VPKTIAITPSWYWPAAIPRVLGVPPFSLGEALVQRWARHRPDDVALADSSGRLTGRQFVEQVMTAAAALRVRSAANPGPARFCAGASVEGAVLLLAALEAGIAIRLVAPSPQTNGGEGGWWLADSIGAAALGSATGVTRLADLGSAGDPAQPAPPMPLDARILGVPTGGDLVWHSHRSMVGGAHSMRAFLGASAARPWLSTLPLSTWEGVYGITVPLAAGAGVVLAPGGDEALDAIARESVAVSSWMLDDAFNATRDAKRQVKAVRDVQEHLVLWTPRSFDPGDRSRVGKLFGCPALTVFGLPETGPIFASHPSWYIDESIGIAISNAFVVPVDPRSGQPIPTLWELVESAMVTVSCPGLCEGYEGDVHPERWRDGRFVTGLIASSDANGMVYLLPD